MALTIGTDAYITEADADTYHSDRGNTDWAALDSTTKEVNIRKATDWIDRNYTFVGEKATAAQRLKWPRCQAYYEGYLLSETDIPWQVQEAAAIMADIFRAGTFDTEGIVTDDEAAISMQKVDVITVQYDTSKRLRGKDVMTHVDALLSGISLSRGQLARAI